MLSKTIWNSVQITHWPRNRAAGSHLSMTETETETPSAEITGHNTLLLWSMAKQFQCALSLEYNKWQLRVASSGFSIRFSSFEIVKQSTHTHTYTDTHMYTDTHTGCRNRLTRYCCSYLCLSPFGADPASPTLLPCPIHVEECPSAPISMTHTRRRPSTRSSSRSHRCHRWTCCCCCCSRVPQYVTISFFFRWGPPLHNFSLSQSHMACNYD